MSAYWIDIAPNGTIGLYVRWSIGDGKVAPGMPHLSSMTSTQARQLANRLLIAAEKAQAYDLIEAFPPLNNGETK